MRLLTAVNCDKLVTERSRKIPLADRLFFSLSYTNRVFLFCILFFLILSVVTEIIVPENLFYKILNAFRGRAKLKSPHRAVTTCIAQSDAAGE